MGDIDAESSTNGDSVIDVGPIGEDQGPDQVEEAKRDGQFWDVKRKTGKKKAVHTVVIISIYVLWIFAFSVLAVRLWHLITPYKVKWLLHFEIQTLDNFLFSGVVGSILAKYGDKILKD